MVYITPRDSMSGQEALAQGSTQSSVIFQNDEQSIIVVDIPRSLEEAQVPRGHKAERHILSTEPLTAPFATPEPKDALTGVSSSAAAQVAGLMTTATVESFEEPALDDDLEKDFSRRYPSLSGIEMVETEIGGGQVRGTIGKEV